MLPVQLLVAVCYYLPGRSNHWEPIRNTSRLGDGVLTRAGGPMLRS